MKICIDPGHSGPVEPGACAGGFTEAAINLAIGLVLGELLRGKGHEVILTRSGDIEDDGLAFRADIANEAGADIFISVHCNAAERLEARGVETYHYPGSAEGLCLAQAIQAALCQGGYTLDRGVKEADFAVLRLTDMPAVLIECGFITSEADREVLISEAGQRLIAEAIVSSIGTESL
ncbi:MAG: N-acetylmuramoyl-L-alanine amidase [Pelosinus sp.]|nr:N-acetylmuramoyl-L-alanine amidase [Pelosinus sp.]